MYFIYIIMQNFIAYKNKNKPGYWPDSMTQDYYGSDWLKYKRDEYAMWLNDVEATDAACAVLEDYPFSNKHDKRRINKRMHDDRSKKQKRISKCTYGHGGCSHPTLDMYFSYGGMCEGPHVKGKAMKKQSFRGQKGKTKGRRDLVRFSF